MTYKYASSFKRSITPNCIWVAHVHAKIKLRIYYFQLSLMMSDLLHDVSLELFNYFVTSLLFIYFFKKYFWAGFKAKVLGTLELCVCHLFSLQGLTFCNQACLASVLVWNSPCAPAMPHTTPGTFRLTFSRTQPFKEERSLGVEI